MATTTTMIHSASPDRLCLRGSARGAGDSGSGTSSYSSSSSSSQRGNQLLDALVAALERVLAQHCALGLIVELEVHPVDGVVTLALFGPLDEFASEPGAGGLWWDVDRGVDVGVDAHPLDHAAVLQLVEGTALAGDVVVLEVEQLHPGVTEREV